MSNGIPGSIKPGQPFPPIQSGLKGARVTESTPQGQTHSNEATTTSLSKTVTTIESQSTEVVDENSAQDIAKNLGTNLSADPKEAMNAQVSALSIDRVKALLED